MFLYAREFSLFFWYLLRYTSSHAAQVFCIRKHTNTHTRALFCIVRCENLFLSRTLCFRNKKVTIYPSNVQMYNTLTRWYFVWCVWYNVEVGAQEIQFGFFSLAFRYFISLDLSQRSSNYEMYVSVWFLFRLCFANVLRTMWFFSLFALFISHFCYSQIYIFGIFGATNTIT